MRMHVVVVGEPNRQLLKNRQCIPRWIDVHIVPLERFDERFGHAVALRRAIRRSTRRQADVLCKASRLPSNVARSVVAEPFCGTGQTGNLPKALDHRLHHHIPNEFAADARGRRGKGDRLPIATIEAEGHPHPFAIATADLKAIGAIPLIAVL